MAHEQAPEAGTHGETANGLAAFPIEDGCPDKLIQKNNLDLNATGQGREEHIA